MTLLLDVEVLGAVARNLVSGFSDLYRIPRTVATKVRPNMCQAEIGKTQPGSNSKLAKIFPLKHL